MSGGAVWLEGGDARLASALGQALAAAGIALATSADGAAAVIWLGPPVGERARTAVPHLALVNPQDPAPIGVASLTLPVRLPAVLDWLHRALSQRQISGWRLEPAARRLLHPSGAAVRLTELEARLLAALLDGAVHPPATLLAAGWPGRRVLPATLATHIHRLRAKLDAVEGPVLISRARVGYQVLARTSVPVYDSATASAGDLPMTIERFSVGPRMSGAVKTAGLVFTAGQVADDTSQDVAGQTRQVLAKIDALLAAAGTDKSKLVSASVWLSDISTFQQMNGVWDSWVVPGHTPARATVEAKLATPAYTVEIAVVAGA